jgi:AraC family transcriptional regulator
MTDLGRLRFSNSGIDCKHASYGPGSSMGRHYHDDTTVVFTIAGSFTHKMRSRSTCLTPTGLLYLPAGETHADDFGPKGAACFITAIDAAWVSQRLPTSDIDTKGPRIDADGYLRGLVLKMYEEFQQPDSLSDLIVEGTFLELLGRLFREKDQTHHDAPSWMRRIKAMLQDSFREPISLRDLARTAGVHPSHLAREFHRIYGLTVGDYIRKLRVNYVAARLTNTGQNQESLTDLSLHAGFSSHAHMCSTFKRAVGMTPSQYKKAHGITSIR